MKSARLFLLAVSLAFLGKGTGVAQPNANDSPWQPVATWRQREGLLQDTIYGILRTRDGYLWVATRSGVCRFDGMRFTTFDDRDPAILRENETQALAEGSDGSVWIATYGGGASRYAKGKFTVFTEKDGLSSDFVVALAAARDGSMWLGMDGGLTRYRDGQFTRYTKSDGLTFDNVRALFADTDDSLWICTKPYGLHRLKNGQITREFITGLPPDAMVLGVSRDREGNSWFSTANGLFRVKPDGDTVHYTTANGLPTNRTGRSIYAAPDGAMWFASDTGLIEAKNGQVRGFAVKDLAAPELVHVVHGDTEGNLWVGVAGKGLVQLRERLFHTYTTHDGLAGQMAHAIVEDTEHNVWIGTTRGLSVRRDGALRSIHQVGLPEGAPIPSLLADTQGRLWVATETGLYRGLANRAAAGEPNTFTEIKAQGLPFIHAKWIFEDRAHRIWIATDVDGLLLIDGENTTRYTTREGLAHNNVLGLSQDRDGAIWIGTRAGLNRLQDGKFTVFRQADGLATDSVEATFRDRDDTLWITTRHGLTRLKDGKFKTFTANDGLFANFVHSLVEDDHGYLWMASDRGPFRVAKQQLDDFADGRRRSIDSQAYGVEHGLLSTDCVGGYSPSTTRTSDGLIWFGTVEGVSVVDPTRLVRNTVPPPVHIESVSIDGQAVDPQQDWLAKPGRGDMEIHYAGLCFTAPEKVTYRYRLDGYDTRWIDAEHRAAAYYSNLPPGHYRFQVIAANNDGVWNTTGAAFAFDLKPHFYQTNWFIGGCALLVLAGGIWLHALRTHQLRARGEVLARHVAERSAANERLQAEILERQNVERALRASEERYRSFFEEDLAGSFIASPDGKILACNPSFAKMFGFRSPAEGIGCDARRLFREPADYEQLSARLQTERKVHDYALELQRADGTILNVVANLIANVDENGVVVQKKGYFIDVTERNELEAQLRHAQKMEAVGRLAGGIAHDFNNLLTGIIGYAQLLMHEHGLSQAAAASAQEILNAGKLAAVLTRQLLSFSRRQIVEPRVLDLNVAVAELKRMLQRLIGEDIDLDLRLDEQPLFVRADPGQIEQVILNLAINSRDAMSRGGRLTIATSSVTPGMAPPAFPTELPPGPYVKLTVSDNGCGMSPEVRARLFEPFFTTKPVGQGTGLGLSTVLGIVRQNKGAITVETAPSSGTAFEIWFPRLPAADEPTASADAPSCDTKFARVLVVEDNELVRQTTAQILRREGYDVVEASNAKDAMKLVTNATFTPDLVLTDVVMPDRNGRDLADDLARLRPHLRIVFMSGYTDDAMLRRDLETHHSFVEKPFTRESLLRKMREALSG